MNIRRVTPGEKSVWNEFVREHYPPIGAFMQTWEWGLFQEKLGRKMERYFVVEGKKPIAVFTFVYHSLPYGFSYGYIPRGPVFATQIQDEKSLLEVFKHIRQWSEDQMSHLVFIRLEPPMTSAVSSIQQYGFYPLSYYIQPRHNIAISLGAGQEAILGKFHHSARSNVRRAEKRGVSVEMKSAMTESDFKEFFSMIHETITRNGGKNAFPDEAYFRALIATLPKLSEVYEPKKLSLGIFFGRQNGEPAGIHFVLFFADTATYLFGASRSDRLSSKVTTYLHWTAMREAQKRGLALYDLGGVDNIRWPTLSQFKRQFGGTEFHYIGNLDIPLRPMFHHAYNMLRRLKKFS